MILEVVDKMCIAAMKVASIVDMIDCRLHLQYEGGKLCFHHVSDQGGCNAVLIPTRSGPTL